MNSLKNAIAIAAILLLPSCATIVSKSNWPFAVSTNPHNVSVSVTNKKGIEVFKGKSPTEFLLRSGSGFFGKESYTVTLTKEGYEPKKVTIECRLNGWYFGNLLIGGWLGMLIIDPATGAMYKLAQKSIYEKMESTSTTTSLKIMDMSELPKEMENQLVRIN